MSRKINLTENIRTGRITYGIEIITNDITETYPDITANKEKAEQLIRNLEDSDISAVHIKDIIRDFIAEEACDKLLANSLL